MPLCRVFITGRGIITAGITSIEEIWNAVLKNQPLIEGSNQYDILKNVVNLASSDASILSKQQLLSLAVAEIAWHNAKLAIHHNPIRGEKKSKKVFQRFGCLNGTTFGGLVEMELETGMKKKISPYSLSRWRGNAIGSCLAIRYGLGGMEFSVNSASCTGAQILFLAGTLIQQGILDAVLAVTVDCKLSPTLERAMKKTGCISNKLVRGSLLAERDGMYPSEGAAAMILESENHAKARGAKLTAEWIQGMSASEAYHLVAPDPSGKTLSCLLQEMRFHIQNIFPSQYVDWISLHATGTKRFDAIEIATIQNIFPDQLPWITAFKKITGHLLGTSGMVESILVCEGLSTGYLPPWPFPMDPIFNLPEERLFPKNKPSLAFQISQGMGGSVVVNSFSKIT